MTLRGPKRINRRGRREAAEIIFGKEQSRFLARRFFALSAVKIIILETLNQTSRLWLKKPGIILAGLLILALSAAAIAAAPTENARAGILQFADRFTRVRGLGDCLTSAGLAWRDLSDNARKGELDLRGLDLLIVGSFATDDDAIRETLAQLRDKLSAFVRDGGIAIVLSQADQTVADEPWLEPAARITRCDYDYTTPVLLNPGHPLFTTPVNIVGGFRDWRGMALSWESIVSYSGVGVLAAENTHGRHPCIVEAEWGRGRALILTIPFDKAFVKGNTAARRLAVALSRNLFAYASAVKAGEAPPVSVFVRPEAYRHAITGLVFRDANGNGVRDSGEIGIANVSVSDGGDVVLTDNGGRYQLPNAGYEARFVFVSVPAGYRKGGQFWHGLEPSATPRSFDFALAPAGSSGERFSFAHISDIHTGRKGTRGLLAKLLEEIARLDEQPRFIVATGDLTERGEEPECKEYQEAISKSVVPVLNVAGNHDVLADPANYQNVLGPEYYSFDEGRFHFIVLTSFDKTPRYHRWLERDRATLAKDKPLILLQHYEPKADQYEPFASWGTRLLCHGHWHGNRIVTYKGMTVLSTPTPLFGGIDASPPSFHVIEADGERLSATRRLSFQNRRLTIVSPSENLVQRGPKLQIIANAYDTARPPKSARFELKRDGTVVTSGALVADGDWSWAGQTDTTGLDRESYEIVVSMSDAKQQMWSASRRFVFSEGKTPPLKPGSEDWPTYLGNAQRNRQPAAVIRPPLSLTWMAPIGPPLEFSAPVLAQGTIYVSLRNRGFPGDNGVLALDALTGARKWFTATESGVHNSVAVDSATVYASSVGGRTYAFDARNGRERWHVDHGSDHLRWVYQSPLVLGDRLIAGNSAHLSNIDRATGRELWHRAFNPDWMPTFGSFAASGRTLLACADWAKVGLAAFDAETSRALWGLGIYGCMSTPVIADDRVYFTEVNGTAVCFPLAGGKALWTRPFKTLTRQSPATVSSAAVAGDRVIVACGKVAALDRPTSDVLWQFEPDPPAGGYSHPEINTYFSSPVVSGDLVWIGSGTGYLYALDLKTGGRVAHIEFGVPVLSTPLAWGNSIYVATYDGHLYCLTHE
jgi:outer membrane protein assembly factor BamB